jgi:hypothetical protein
MLIPIAQGLIMTQACVDLELTLQRGAGGFTVALRAHAPRSAADHHVLPVALPNLQVDDPQLLGLTLDPLAYGRHLSALLFAHPAIRSAYLQARTVAERDNLPLRIRLTIAPDAPELHNLSWETLTDPERGGFLSMSERILFSRYLSSSDWRPVRLAARP